MKIHGEERVYEGIHVRIYHQRVELTEGVFKTFEYVWRLDGTRTIAINNASEILLTNEYRYELRGRDWRLPGGKLDYEGENPEEAARREFEEETGYKAKMWEYLWSTTPDSFITYKRLFFLATDIIKGKSSKEMGEDIAAHWLPLQQAYHMAIHGEIREEISALTIIRLYNEILEGKRKIAFAR